MRLEFSGKVGRGDAYRCNDDRSDEGAVFVGETDIVGEVSKEEEGKEMEISIKILKTLLKKLKKTV